LIEKLCNETVTKPVKRLRQNECRSFLRAHGPIVKTTPCIHDLPQVRHRVGPFDPTLRAFEWRWPQRLDEVARAVAIPEAEEVKLWGAQHSKQ